MSDSNKYMPWQSGSLGDFITLQRGFDITSREYTDGQIPVIASSGTVGWCSTAKELGPGVVIGRKGSLGTVHYSEGPYWPSDTTLWVRDFRESAPRFVFYFLKGLEVKHLDVGSANPTLNRNHLHAVPVLWPNITDQRRIAGVLGSLDDLIEVNRGLIVDLLAMAKVVASGDRGLTEELTFGEVCDVFGGGTPSTKNEEFWNGDVRWATPSDITALPSPFLFDTGRHITSAGLDACSSTLMPTGSILMTSRATIGAFAVAQRPTAVNQGFIAVEPRNEIDRWFLLQEMQRRVPEFIQRANGSTFLELSRGVFKALSVSWPDEQTRSNLHAKLDPLYRAAASLQEEIAELRSTRDELLPLLLSGRVRVGDVAA